MMAAGNAVRVWSWGRVGFNLWSWAAGQQRVREVIRMSGWDGRDGEVIVR